MINLKKFKQIQNPKKETGFMIYNQYKLSKSDLFS